MNLRQVPLRLCINLESRPERWQQTQGELVKHSLCVRRFLATDARHAKNLRGWDRAARYGCALTHRRALFHAWFHNVDSVLILEDDVLFHPELVDRFDALQFPDDWDMIYLGCQHFLNPTEVSPGVVRVAKAYDSHAILYRRKVIPTIIGALKSGGKNNTQHKDASDVLVAAIQPEIKAYACLPNLAWQRDVESDIANRKYSNYNEDGSQKHWSQYAKPIPLSIVDATQVRHTPAQRAA